jgi:hypothetical protein
MGHEPGSRSVKRTPVAEAFATVGHKMLFMFDYSDDWRTGRKGPQCSIAEGHQRVCGTYSLDHRCTASAQSGTGFDMTKEFTPLPSPHPEEWRLAPSRAAPIVGQIILEWTKLERDMNRAILTARMLRKRAHPAERKLSQKFRVNLNEWIRLFMPDHTEGERASLWSEMIRLHLIRNDIAHNIWTLRLDREFGVTFNVVRVNDRFWEQEAARLAEQGENPGRQQKPAPETFPTGTYFEADLTRAIDDIARVMTSMRQIESTSFFKHS